MRLDTLCPNSVRTRLPSTGKGCLQFSLQTLVADCRAFHACGPAYENPRLPKFETSTA